MTSLGPNLAKAMTPPETTRSRWTPDSFLTRSAFEPRPNTRGASRPTAGMTERDLVAVDAWIADLLEMLRPTPNGASAVGAALLHDLDRALFTLHAETSELRASVRRSLGRSGRRGEGLRAAYGIASGHTLPDVRLLVCLAADARFNAYASGFWEVTAPGRTDPRIDMRSVCNAVWTWANGEVRPLAVVLRHALTHPHVGEVQPFPPFTKLFARVLSMHPSLPGDVESRATFLSSFCVARFQALGPARSAERYLLAPVMQALRAHKSRDIRLEFEEPPESARQRLPQAVMPLFVNLRSDSDDTDPVAMLEQVTTAMRLASSHERD